MIYYTSMMRLKIMFWVLLCVFAASVSEARTMAPDYVKCPLGGQVTSTWTWPEMRKKVDDYSPGPALGPITVLPLDQCANGFIIYKQSFSDKELAVLAHLIALPEFKALRDRPTYEQLRWLRSKQGADQFELTELLFLAVREVRPDRDKETTLLREYVKAVDALPFIPARHNELIDARLHVVNLLRERGSFDLATSILDVNMQSELLPPKGAAQDAVQKLLVLLMEKNSARWPVIFFAPEIAADMCLKPDHEFSRSESAYCRSGEVRLAMERQWQQMPELHYGRRHLESCEAFDPTARVLVPVVCLLALVLLLATFGNMWRADRRTRLALVGRGS